jgi:hypothetical protein
MRQLLGRLDAMNDWAALATVLRRVLAGERDPDELTAGLDEIDTAIVQRLSAWNKWRASAGVRPSPSRLG